MREIAGRSGLEVVKVYKDHGISGAKGRDKRPGFDALCRDAAGTSAGAAPDLDQAAAQALSEIQSLRGAGLRVGPGDVRTAVPHRLEEQRLAPAQQRHDAPWLQGFRSHLVPSIEQGPAAPPTRQTSDRTGASRRCIAISVPVIVAIRCSRPSRSA